MHTYNFGRLILFSLALFYGPTLQAQNTSILDALQDAEAHLSTSPYATEQPQEKIDIKVKVDFLIVNYDTCTFLAKRNILRNIFKDFANGHLDGAHDLRDFLEIEYGFLRINPQSTKKYKAEYTLVRKRLNWLNNALNYQP